MKQLTLPLFMCAALAACSPSALNQSPPVQAPGPHSPVAKVPDVRPSLAPSGRLPQAVKPTENGLDLKVVSDGQTDTISSRALKIQEAGFKTQAFDRNLMRYVQFSVVGPGIPVRITGPMIDLTTIPGAPAVLGSLPVDLSGIPTGPNRIVTAQFFDMTQTALPLAVAKGFYSSTASGTQTLDLRRRYLPLAAIIESLLISNPTLAASLDLNQMQIEIQKMLFGGDGTVINPTFDVDPIRLDTTAMTSSLTAANGVIGPNTLNDNAYVKTYAQISNMLVSGLVTGESLQIRLGDPTSMVSETSNTVAHNIPSISPGEWPMTITLPQGVEYSVTSLNPNNIPYQYDAQTRQISATVPFGIGANLNNLQLTVDYPNPEIESISLNQGPRGTDLVMTGQHFHPTAASNIVKFISQADSSETLATVTSATATRLEFKVPAVPDSGDYNLSVAVGTKSAITQFKVQRVWHVATDGNPATTGADWAQATTLQHALADAGDGDDIWLKTGVYKPHASDRTVSFRINKSLTIYGGFAGSELSQSARNPALYPVTLSGDLAGDENYVNPVGAVDLDPASALRDDNSYHVVSVFSPDGPPFNASVQIEGVNIYGGNANNPQTGGTAYYPEGCTPNLPDPPEDYYCEAFTQPDPYRNGGGIENYAELVLKNVNIRYNSAIGEGAGIYHKGQFLTVGRDRYDDENPFPVLFEHNRAEGSGGGLYIDGPNAVYYSRFRHNQAFSGGAVQGVSAGEGYITLHKNLFEANSAIDSGGAVFSGTQLDLWRNHFVDNTAGQNGGGLYYDVITGMTEGRYNVFMGNNALRGGAAYLRRVTSYSSSKTLSSWTFFRNNASVHGDGLYYLGLDGMDPALDLVLQNMLFYDDTVARGGDTSFLLESSLSNGPLANFVSDEGSFTRPAYTTPATNYNGNPNQVFFNTDPDFSDINNPSGGDGWGSGEEGLRPQSSSSIKGLGTYLNPYTGDTDAGGVQRTPGNANHIGAYVIP